MHKQYRTPYEDDEDDDLVTDSAVAGDSGLGMSSSRSTSTSSRRPPQPGEDDRGGPILVSRDGKSSLTHHQHMPKYSPADTRCFSDTRTDSGFDSYNRSGERFYSNDSYGGYDFYDASNTSSYHSTTSSAATDSHIMRTSTTSTTSDLYDDDVAKQDYTRNDSGVCLSVLSEQCISTDSAIDVVYGMDKLNIGPTALQQQHISEQYIYHPTPIETSSSTYKVCHSPKPISNQESWHVPTFILIDAFQQDIDGDTTLHLAIIHELQKEVLNLIDHVPDPTLLNLQNNLLQTALHLAVLTNQPKIVRKLVVTGAALDMRDRRGNTALHIACQEGNLPCTQELLLVCPVMYSDYTSTLYQPLEGYGRMPDLDLRNYDGQNCVHLATRGKHYVILQLLRQYGADINAQEGKSGRTALHYAVEARDGDLVRFLVEDCQAAVNTQTFAGLTPIQLAYNNNRQIVNQLLRMGAKDVGPPPSDSESDSSSDEMTSMDTIDDMDGDFLINGTPLSSF